jgi:WD40 repeat protein
MLVLGGLLPSVWAEESPPLEWEHQFGHVAPITGAAFNEAGDRVVTLSEDGLVYLWDATTGEKVRSFFHWEARMLGFSRDGRWLVAGAKARSVVVWNARTGQTIQTLKVPESLESLALSGDGKRLVNVPSGRKVVQLWDLSKGGESILCTQEQFIDTAHLSMDGRRLATSGFWGNVVRIWDASTGKELKTLRDDKMSVDGLSLSRDGGKLLAVMPSGRRHR